MEALSQSLPSGLGDIPRLEAHRGEVLLCDIDNLISDQLNRIIHHPSFQALEARWRGLDYLVRAGLTAPKCKIKLFDVTWREIGKDATRSLEFDQSEMFHRVYSDEFGTPGGEPFGALIGDFEVTHNFEPPQDHSDAIILTHLAQIAAAAFAPIILGASARMFGVKRFADLRPSVSLEDVFASDEYRQWKTLRLHPDCRFVGLTLPRILMREPYTRRPDHRNGLYFHERLRSADDRLWGNAAFAFAAILLREFAAVGWFAHIRATPRDELGGGLVTQFPSDLTEDGLAPPGSPMRTECVITDGFEKDLSEHGFIPLCQGYRTAFGAFFSNNSIAKNRVSAIRDKTSRPNDTQMLQHLLCGSRIAQYIKVIFRDKIGSFKNTEACEQHLTQWLYHYTTGRSDLDWQAQARYPLRNAKVKVREHPDKPGHFICKLRLTAHHQIEQMFSELELVTELAHIKE